MPKKIEQLIFFGLRGQSFSKTLIIDELLGHLLQSNEFSKSSISLVVIKFTFKNLLLLFFNENHKEPLITQFRQKFKNEFFFLIKKKRN